MSGILCGRVKSILDEGHFPLILGGDHSIGFPTVRGVCRHLGDKKVGIIHFDRHTDMSELIMDERMHGTPFFHATNIPNAPAANLVQIGIGGWLEGRANGVMFEALRVIAVAETLLALPEFFTWSNPGLVGAWAATSLAAIATIKIGRAHV